MTGEHAGETLDVLRRLAAESDLGIIVHDEGDRGRQRLSAGEADQYAGNISKTSTRCHVSIENSYNSGDITWFWERFVMPAPPSVSITLDIGHLELAGLDSISFVQGVQKELVERIAFVHMHHHDSTTREAVPDHKPLVKGCREIEALKLLLQRKRDLRVILELDAAEDGMAQSIELLEQLRNVPCARAEHS